MLNDTIADRCFDTRSVCPRPLVSCLLALPLILFTAFAVSAQDASLPVDIDDAEEPIDEIVVTGTRIKRRDFQTASPLTTVNTDDILFEGQATIEELLNDMPQVMPSLGRTANNPYMGQAYVDLRGLGSLRTLVLLNGRRVAPSSSWTGADLNNIPQSLVERVEIITGGTSAVYGSDALAGVVNFITRSDFEGFGFEVGMTMTEMGDAETYDANVTFGHNFDNDRGNAILYVDYLERQPLLSAEREHTAVDWYDMWDGTLRSYGSPINPGGLVHYPRTDIGSGFITFDPDGTPREYLGEADEYHYARWQYIQIPMDRLSFGVMGHYALSDRVETYVEASHTSNEPSQQLAPIPAFLTGAEVNLDNPVLTPESRQIFTDYYTCDDNLACLTFSRRLEEIGPRVGVTDADYTRVVGGVRGELWDGWDFDAWVTHTYSTNTYTRLKAASRSRMLQSLLVDPLTGECYDPGGGCVPLDPFGPGRISPEAAEFITEKNVKDEYRDTQILASMFISGPLFNNWAGSVDTAIGVEWRSDETHYRPDERSQMGDLASRSAEPIVRGKEELYEVYAEAVVPLARDASWAKDLTLELGGRYSDYRNAGESWTYKAGINWQPVDGLRVRAMQQQSSRAPNRQELFQEQVSELLWVESWSLRDPCSASRDPVGNGYAEKCIIQGLAPDLLGVFEAPDGYLVTMIGGGNPDLVPETSDTWTAGVVINPSLLPSWMLSVDYFSIEIEDTIGSANSTVICFDPSNTSHAFCKDIVRDETGQIATIYDIFKNRGLMETTGFDTQIQYMGNLPDFLSLGNYAADIRWNIYWTHMLSNREQKSPVAETLDCAGYFGSPCPRSSYPENKISSSLHYSSGPLDAHLSWRWIDRMKNATPMGWEWNRWCEPDLGCELAIPEIGSEQYFDLGLSYRFNNNVTTYLGVQNLLDNDPPMTAETIGVSGNTDIYLYDVFGRSYYFSVAAEF